MIYASFKRRLMATIIDILILFPVMAALLFFWYGSDEFSAALIGEARNSSGSRLINYLFPFLVTCFFWRIFMATPGKLLVNCCIVDADSGEPMTWRQIIIRYFAYLLSALPLYLGFLWIIWDERKQSFHDKLANTIVITQDEQ